MNLRLSFSNEEGLSSVRFEPVSLDVKTSCWRPRPVLAAMLIFRNPVKIWQYGGWSAASWCSQGPFWQSLKRGAPSIIEEIVSVASLGMHV